jgi:hypothetical protein
MHLTLSSSGEHCGRVALESYIVLRDSKCACQELLGLCSVCSVAKLGARQIRGLVSMQPGCEGSAGNGTPMPPIARGDIHGTDES